MKQILLPTDFSDYALNAIFTAIKLQHKNPCHFILLHTYEPDTRNITSRQNVARAGTIYDALHKNAVSKLEETLQAITKVSEDSKHTFSIQAQSGDLASVIRELVPKHDLDFIIMGTKGATGAQRVFFGSNMIRVLKKIRSCPVLAVPRQFNFQSLKNIVFPTEYANFFSKGQLNPLITLAEVWRSQLLIFHVAQEFKLSEVQKRNKKTLIERIGAISHSFCDVAIHTTVAEAITEFANEQAADMICLVHYHHTFLEKLTQEPIVKKIGFHTEIPLLVLPE